MKNAPSKWARMQPSFKVMEVLKRARELEHEGRRVIHFEVGEPDFPTASVIVEAGNEPLTMGTLDIQKLWGYLNFATLLRMITVHVLGPISSQAVSR